MKKRTYFGFSRISFLLLLLSLFNTAALPQTAQTAATATTSAATAVSSTPNQVTEYEVNGLKVLIKRRPGTPTVAAGLFLRGGVRNTTAENAGIESFMLDTATEGSKNFPLQTLRKELSRTGSSISSGSNYDYSVYSLASTRQHFERTWQIFTDITLNPTFAADDVERVRKRRLSSLRAQNDSPESALEVQQEKVIFANHPYANNPEGTVESITKLKAEELRAYHQKAMQTSRLLLVIVGDVEPEAMRKQIADSFGKLPRGDYKDSALSALSFAKPSVDITSRSQQIDYVKGVFAAPSISDPDYYAMRVAIAMLQQQVFQEVRVKRNLSYAPGADMNSSAANTANISFSSGNPNEAARVMLDEIARLKNTPPGQDTILELSSFFLTTYYLKQETNAAQAAEIASYELTGGGWRNSLDFLDKMRQVKPEDVQRVAKKYMTNIRFLVNGNPTDIDKKIFLQDY